MTYIVGLLGYSKAGKDEAGKALLDEGFKRYAFGDEVKIELAAELGIPVEDLHNHNKEKYRDQMVAYGEGKRKENKNYWIDRLRDKIMEDVKAGVNVVITDIRRVSEIDFIEQLKWMSGNGLDAEVSLVHIDRPEAELDNDTASNYAMNYAKRYNKIDITIVNKYSSEILYSIMKYELNTKIFKK